MSQTLSIDPDELTFFADTCAKAAEHFSDPVAVKFWTEYFEMLQFTAEKMGPPHVFQHRFTWQREADHNLSLEFECEFVGEVA